MKYLLALLLVLAMAFPVFANNDNTIIGGGNTQVNGNNNNVGGTSIGGGITNTNTFNPTNLNTNVGINTNVNDVRNTVSTDIRNTNTNLNTNINDVDLTFRPTNTNIGINGQDQNQKQGQIQGQGQLQGQNNDQRIKQEVKFESPVQLPVVVNPAMSDLMYGNGRIRFKGFPFDFSTDLPEYDKATMRISAQLAVKANVKMKDFIGVVTETLAEYAGQPGVAYIIMITEANKTSQIGANFNGLASGVGATGTGGGGGGGVLGGQIGITKAHDLGTVIVVKVVPPKKAERLDLQKKYSDSHKTKVIYQAPKVESKPVKSEVPRTGTSIFGTGK